MPTLPDSASAVLVRVLGHALVRGEVSIARTRQFVLAVAAVEELVFLAMHPEAAHHLLGWLPLAALGAGAVFTTLELRRLRREGAAPRASSAALDAALILGVALPVALQPDATYSGAFHHPPSVFFLLAIAAAGLRLSRPLVRVAAVTNSACMLLLLAIDFVRGSPTPRVDEWILWTMAFFGASFLADGMALRARKLAHEVAGAVLAAERARQALDVYVSTEVADEVLAGEAVAPGGHRQAVAVLVAELTGFSAYSGQVPPERLVSELNAWLGAMVEVVGAQGGVVDRFTGAGLIACFGMPRTLPDAASRALRASVEMHRALVTHNIERAGRGAPALRLSIGLNYGEVVVGNIGTPDRMQYTAVGEAVNTAARLQGIAKDRSLLVAAPAGLIEFAGPVEGVPRLEALGAVELAGRTGQLVLYGLRSVG